MARLFLLPFILLAFAFINVLEAQLPYTEIQYDYRVDSSVYYGTAINYAGNPVELYLDIYKPIGDNNRNRPTLVMAFGGAWIGGNKRSSDITSIAPWFARRGFVVAAIDYRLGFHPSVGTGSNYLTCPPVTIESNCVYPADSNEVIRAMFRGMQDLKGAIRFMKARNLEDSLCIENFFVAGVSAGGFNALAAAFLDDDSEKPAAAFAIGDAPGPAGALNYCHNYYNASGAQVQLNRPDLGSIEGDIALNGYNAEVAGAFNFIGGVMHDYFGIENGVSPLLYIHHQTSDLVVSCTQAPILSSLSVNCLAPLGFLGCTTIGNMPRARGSCAIETLINNENYDINFQSVISQTGGPNCLQDPPGHSVVSPQTRVAEIVTFISERISQNETSGCNITTSHAFGRSIECPFSLYPNPSSRILYIGNPRSMKIESLKICDASGKSILQIHSPATDQIDLRSLDQGLYFLEIQTKQNRYLLRFIATN
jgi:pimeloyl-ACP methyl ester carboxylesterase